MWGDHLLASLIRLHHISTPVRAGLVFLFLHLPRNDTIPRMLWMRSGRHIFLHRWVCCKCSFCQHHSGFCNYGTDRLKSWIIRKLKEKNYFINCGVLDGFLALIKTVTIRLQCCNNFFLKISLISSISCVRFENEWQSVGRSQSRVACRLAANKQFVFQTDNVAQNFLEAEVNEIQK